MAFKRLELRNFQAHRHLKIDLSPGITTIIGASDQGKSAIIRAIQWVCLNKPSGEAYRTHGTKRTQVTLTVDEHVIIRRRSDKSNTYLLDGQMLKSFGTSPPQAISDLLKLGAFNFQGQHDPSLWFHLSPGQVSKELNRIVNLSQMDRIINKCAKRLREESIRKELTMRRLAEATERRDALTFVPKADRALTRLESLEARSELLKSYISELDGLLERAWQLEAKTAAEPPQIDPLKRLFKRVEGVRSDCKSLESLLDKISHTRTQLCRFRKNLKATRKRLSAIQTCPLCGSPVKL